MQKLHYLDSRSFPDDGTGNEESDSVAIQGRIEPYGTLISVQFAPNPVPGRAKGQRPSTEHTFIDLF